MAVFNEILEGRFNNLIRKMLSIKSSAPSGQVSSEIMPVFTPFQFGNEMNYLEGWQHFRYGMHQPAGAAAFQESVLRSPGITPVAPNAAPNANVTIVVVERFVISPGANDVVTLQKNQNANLAFTVAAGFEDDNRWNGSGFPNTSVARSWAIGSSANTAVVPTKNGPLASVAILANTPTDILQGREYTMLPGDGLIAFGTTVNLTWDVSLVWRERLLAEGESF